MFGLPNGVEWIIILIIVVLLFGPGRIGRLFGEVGKGLRAFREGLGKEKTEAEDARDADGNIEPK